MASLNGVRVVIIGAGLAGLVAARALAKRGAIVEVLEARERVGGRIWTWRQDPIAPFSVEVGGEFIDGEHRALRALARELGLSLVRVLRGGFGLALEHHGRVRVHHTQASIWREFQRALAPVRAPLEEVKCDWDSSVAAALAARSLDDLLAARRASADVRGMAEALRGFFLADSDRLSALVGTELSMEDVDPGHVPLYRIKGGNDRLPLALLEDADVRVAGKHIARAITQTPAHVQVAVEDSTGALDHVHADYAIVTVPPPILLSWVFDPPLPEDKRRAFEALSYGSATKAVMRFGSPWWRRDSRPRAYGTNLPIGAIWDAAEEQRGAAFLTLLAGGRASASLRELLAAREPDGVLSRMDWMGRVPALAGVASVSWEDDPWAGGGYAFFSTSFPPYLRDSLARAFGRVLFAGDHTSREYQGYMNGAVESGDRVAKEIGMLESVKI